jgi:hypothetical protein
MSVKLTTHLNLMPRPRIVELYLYSPYVFMAWCLINQDQWQFYLTSHSLFLVMLLLLISLSLNFHSISRQFFFIFLLIFFFTQNTVHSIRTKKWSERCMAQYYTVFTGMLHGHISPCYPILNTTWNSSLLVNHFSLRIRSTDPLA